MDLSSFTLQLCTTEDTSPRDVRASCAVSPIVGVRVDAEGKYQHFTKTIEHKYHGNISNNNQGGSGQTLSIRIFTGLSIKACFFLNN